MNGEQRQMTRAAGLISGLTLLSRVAGLARDVVIGYAFGAAGTADAFFVAFRLPELARKVVAEGVAGVAFVPVLTDTLTRYGRAAAADAARALAFSVAALLAVLVILGVVAAPLWVPFAAPGYAGDVADMELTVHLTRLVLPYIFLAGLVAVAAAMLQALRRFTAAATASVVFNLAVIGAVLFLCPRLGNPVSGLAYGVLLGGFLQLALLATALARAGVRTAMACRFRHPAVRRAGRLLAPVLAGGAVFQINLLVATAVASTMQPGTVSCLWYAERLCQFPLGLVATALATAVLPAFSAQVARGAREELRQGLTLTLRLTTFFSLPAAAGLVLLAKPVTLLLFAHGALSPADALRTTVALQALALLVWPVALARVLVSVFPPLHRVRPLAVAAAASVVTNLVAGVLLAGDRAADAGDIAICVVLAALVHVAVLAGGLRGAVALPYRRVLLPAAGKALLASAAMAAIVGPVSAWAAWGPEASLAARTGMLTLLIALGVLAFLGTARLMSCPELGVLHDLVRGREA